MRASTLRTLRFLRTWLSGPGRVDEREVTVGSFPATVFSPVRGRRSGSTWVVLHGVTRPGRRHPQLLRFCRALTRAGGRVVVPEIRDWVELRLAPEQTVPAIRAVVDWIGGQEEGGVGLVGFSFGAPQALRAAAHPSLRDHISGVAGFGGYCDIHRAVRFQLTGRHEWRGEESRIDPDPYGRWIMAGNHLTDIPEHEGARDVAGALLRLATIAGDERIAADSPTMSEHREALREEIAPSRRELYDLLARAPVDSLDPLEALADSLSEAALRVTPLLDVRPHLEGLRGPVELIHGRHDRLIPYTESHRLAEALPKEARVRLTVTELFSHTEGRALRAGLAAAGEGWRFFSALRRVLGMA
ncbi:MAG: hypothetical protein R3223_12740 [Longimicrobiales bacterium]|nr:hypothetical protein [Longimicrobiales bacterium]